MKKYTVKDFLAGKVDVFCKNNAQKKALLKICKDNGVVWNSGAPIDDFTPVYPILGIGYFNKNRLTQSDKRLCRRVVDFDEIDLSPAPRYQITIDCDGNTTTAKMLVNGKEVKTATAKRNPADKANWRIGAQTAFDRLWKKQEKPEKEKEYGGFKVGDRVVIDSTNGIAVSAHGKHGRIVDFSFEDEDEWVWLELDESVYSHSCNGKAKPNCGCVVRLEQLTHELPIKGRYA